ncbi:uncharacterized protein [Aquarana catesbeiana]|uniref:uncharacterized protein isoform X7 n=1 Tax=Aquarana catesbeiana TaxID=8400 RepID=UPI003CC9CF14
MADVPKECAFCKRAEDAESLDRISKGILAHYNCLRCGKCKKSGATVGCDHEECNRTYHYPCVTEAKGIIKRDDEKGQYIVYCREHANSTQLSNGTETTGTFKTSASLKKPRKNKRQKTLKKKMEHSTARKKMSFGGKPESGTVQNAEMCLNSDDEQRGSHQLLDNNTDEEDMEVPGPSWTNLDNSTIVIDDTESEDELPEFNGSQLVNIKGEGISTKDDTSVTGTPTGKLQLQEMLPSPARERTSSISKDSSGSQTPKISRTISLSDFPKRNRKRKRKQNNPELETALLTMHPDEREACSQLYDDVGGSISMSEDLCEGEQMEDTSGTVEDISKDQHTGTKARSDRCNLKIAALESSGSIRTPEGQCASSTPAHDATSVSQLPRHSPSVTSFPSRQLINVNNKVKSTDSLRGERLASTNVKILKSADSTDGVSNARAQPKDIPVCNGKYMFVPLSAVCHNPTKPLVDQPLSPSITNEASDQQQLMTSPNNNISSEQHNKDTKNKDLMLAGLGKTLKKHASQIFSKDALSKTLSSANTDILLNKEPVNSPSLSKTSNEQPMNLQFTSKSTEDQCKQSPGVRKTLSKQPTGTANTTKALVHAVNSNGSNVPVDQKATVLKRQSQSVVHLSAITTGTELLNGQPLCSSLVESKYTEIAASSPTGKEAFLAKELLRKKAPASREEAKQLKQGQTVDEPASPGDLPEDGHMLVEEIADTEQTLDDSASPGNPPEDGCVHDGEDTVLLSGQTSDKPDSPGDLEEYGSMLVEEITHTDEDTVLLYDRTNLAVLTAKSSQTETSSGYPANVDKLMNLGIDQKSKLMESYKEAEKLMSRTGDRTKAAQAFWDLCRENKCREFLLTSVTCYMKSVFHTIVHEEPKDRDFEQAFAFLQASGCFTNFISGTEDDQAKISSRTTSRETYNESDSDCVGSCTVVEDQGVITRDEDPDGMESGSPQSSQINKKAGQCTRDEGHHKVEAKYSRTSSLSVNGKEKESARDEDHDGMQSELSESSLESNRKTESCRGEGHDDIQTELFESCSESSRKKQSTEGDNLDRMEIESPAASLVSPSASRESDLILPEKASRRHRSLEEMRVLISQLQILQYQLQQQTKDGDAGFATNLIQFLRKVPEDKKLSTQMSILKVLSSVLGQQLMSNPGCVPQQYTNQSSPRHSHKPEM